MASGLLALGIGSLGAGPAAAAPSSTLVFSVDGGTTWSANVTAAPGQTVIAREYYDNDTPGNIAGASVTTTLPSGFSLVAGTTEVCLNPGTTDPTHPTSELECNTQTGGAAPNDEGGPINESAVWSEANLAISPTAGLLNQPTNATSGLLANGKVKFLNLDNCVYAGGGVDDYTTLTSTPNGHFNAGTNTSDTATSLSCGAGGGGYAPNGSTVQNIDLLGQAWFNFAQCDYFNGTIVDNLTLFDAPQGSATDASNTATNPTNSASVTPSCTESLGGFGFVAVNSGLNSLDLLDNRYVNLDACDYVGGHDNFTTAVSDVANAPPDYDAGTNASNTAATALSCHAGSGGYPLFTGNSGFLALDTLDTTRGQGFVQWHMTAPSPATTTVYTEDGQLTGSGTGDPSTSGTITVDASVGTPLANPWVLGGGIGVLAVATAGFVMVRRRRAVIDA
jgi:hypothetical protein